MLWSPFLSVEADDVGQRGAADLAQRTIEPAFVIALYALALWGAFLAPRRFVALAGLLLGFNTLAAMVFAGTTRYRAPWDFLLALLAAFALERAWEAVPKAASAGRGPFEGRAIELGGALGAPLLRELGERPLAAGCSERGCPRWVAGELADRAGERVDVGRWDEHARAAVVDDLRQAADSARDHRPPALHRLERDHPEPLPERRHHHDLRPLEDARDARHVAEEGHAVVEPEPCDRRAKLRVERSLAGDLERDPRHVGAGGRERAKEGLVPLDRDEAPDDRQSRRTGQRRRADPGSIP